jgi:hypothetical protein
MSFPEDTIQNVIDPTSLWWEKTDSKTIERGSLIWAFLPYVGQVPYTILPIGRHEPSVHNKATVKIQQLDIKNPRQREALPIAAMSLKNNEIWACYRAKKRPCLVIGKGGQVVKDKSRKNMPKINTNPTFLVAPYYGIDQDGTRGGYNIEFVERVKHMRYPQFIYDQLPISGVKKSILKLDQLQPIGRIDNSFERTGYKLSKEALTMIDDTFKLYMYDEISSKSVLYEFIKLIDELVYNS